MRTKKWKKVILPVALLAVSVLFVACGKKTSGEPVSAMPAGSQGGEEQKENTPTPEVKDDVTPTEEIKNEIMPEIKDDITPTPASQDGSGEAGEEYELPEDCTWGGTYVSEYIGITCEFDSDWAVYTDPLKETQDDLLSYYYYWTELDAEKIKQEDGICIIRVVYFTEDEMEKLIHKQYSEEELVDISLNNKQEQEDYRKQAEENGITVYGMKKKKVMIAGKEHCGGVIEQEEEGIGRYYFFKLINYQMGEYVVNINIFVSEEERVDELCAMFSAYEK